MKRRIILTCLFACYTFLLNLVFIQVVNADTISAPTFVGLERVSATEVKIKFDSNSTCSNCGIMILNMTDGYFYKVSNASASYILGGLKTGKTYEFKISQYYIEGGILYNTPWSVSKYITLLADQPVSPEPSNPTPSVPTPSNPTPSTPSTPTVKTPTFTSLNRTQYNKMLLSYTTSGTVTGVEVYNTTTGKKVKTTNKTNYTWSDLTYDKSYTFKIRSYYKDSKGNYYYSSWTDSKSKVAKVPTPTLKSISVSDYNNVILNYSTTGTITGVQIYNATTDSSVKVTNKTKYTITNLSFNKTYKYKIRTYYKTSSKTYYSYYTDLKSVTTKKLKDNVFDGSIYKFYQGNYSNKFCGVTIAKSGCGPTSMAIVASGLLNKKITPVTMAEYGCKVGDYGKGGSDHDFFDKAIKKYGLKGKWYTKAESDEVLKALSTGKAIVIAHMGKGHFTSGGHYITLVGIKDGNQVKVQDPASSSRSKYWKFSIVKDEAKTKSYTTPFLVVTK